MPLLAIMYRNIHKNISINTDRCSKLTSTVTSNVTGCTPELREAQCPLSCPACLVCVAR